MKARTFLAVALLLPACSRTGEPAGNQSATAMPTPVPAAIGEPARPAPPTRTPTPAATPQGGEPAVPAPTAPRPTTSLPEGPAAPDSGQAAAGVVQTYYALLEQRRYARAVQLWEDRAAAERAVTAVSFARYDAYHANVGGPGEIEGAAGSRYVTVPVHTYGTLKTGRAFAEDGQVTLRRVAEIDGATPEQRRWHITAIDLKPAQPAR